MDATGVVIQAGTTLLFAAILVGWFSWPASRSNSRREAAEWARAYGLALTARNLPMVEYYVKLAITLRVSGGVGGLVLGAVFDDATGLDTSSGVGFWTWIVLGWLLGAGWAEYRLTRPPDRDHAASLTPRTPSDYVSGRMYAAPVVAAAVAVALSVGGLLAPAADEPMAGPPSSFALVVAALGAVAIAGVVRLAIRAVVARRQPSEPVDIVAADDAIRASAVHHLAGGGTAAILLVAAQVASSILEPHQLPFGLRGWVPAVLLLAALVSWRFYAYRWWRVRRTSPEPART